MSIKLNRAFMGALERSLRKRKVHGIMGRRKSDGNYEYDVAGKPGYVWVTIRLSSGAQTAVEANNFKAGVKHARNIAVEMVRDGNEYVIEGKSTRGDITKLKPPDPTGVEPHEHAQYLDLEDLVIAPEQTVLEDTNELLLLDTGVVKRGLWSTIKTTLTTLFNTLYVTLTTTQTITGTKTFTDLFKIDAVGTPPALIETVVNVTTNNQRKLTIRAVTPGGNVYGSFYFGRGSGVNEGFVGFTQRTTALGEVTVFDAALGRIAQAAATITQVTTTGEALKVIRDLAAASTDSPLVNFVQDNAGDDQDSFRVQQDGTGKLFTFLDGATERWAMADGGAATLTGTLNVDGATSVKPGTASDTAKVGGTLAVSTTQVGNVGTGEDVLIDYSVPANTLAVNGQSIWFEASGKCANNANAKTLRVRFGTAGTNLVLENAHINTNAAIHWTLRGRVIRTGAATQKAYASMQMFLEGFTGVGGETSVVTALDQTLSGAVTLRISGEATSDNDITIETFICGWDGENT